MTRLREVFEALGFDVSTTIVIDRLTIHRGMSDEVNGARFLRAARR